MSEAQDNAVESVRYSLENGEGLDVDDVARLLDGYDRMRSDLSGPDSVAVRLKRAFVTIDACREVTRDLREKLAAHVANGANLIEIATTLDSQAAISTRPGQLETLEGVAARLRQMAGWQS